MPYFEYSKSVKNIEYFEILEMLMERWEFEIVEFKEAKGGYDTDKIGRYFSAISNELILRILKLGILPEITPLWAFGNDFSSFQAVC